MGKYVIEFDQDALAAQVAADGHPQFSYVTKHGEAKRDGILQKVLCYSSYYVMTFSAFCAFAPQHVAYAAELISFSVIK